MELHEIESELRGASNRIEQLEQRIVRRNHLGP